MSRTRKTPEKGISYRRVTLTIREDQHELVQKQGLSLSALVRDLIDDRFSSNKIVFNLSDEGKELYETVVAGFGSHDADLEPFFLAALDSFIETRIEALKKVRSRIKKGKV